MSDLQLLDREPSAEAKSILDMDRAVFRDSFERRHFTLGHALAGSELFQLPRLIELARDTAETRPTDLYFDAGDIEIGQRWASSPKSSFPIDETIRRIETARAWIILRQAERASAYGKLLEACMAEIFAAAGPGIEKRISKREVIIFITSPRRITTYHIDRQCNFILQVHGDKQINVFDRNDRDVLPERELEQFWTVDNNAAIYKPQLQDRADVITLRPGLGVHLPVNAPHWLQNGDDISITVSINFQFLDQERASLYRANFFLRKLGIDPVPPWVSPARDAWKRPFGDLAYRIRQVTRGRTPGA